MRAVSSFAIHLNQLQRVLPTPEASSSKVARAASESTTRRSRRAAKFPPCDFSFSLKSIPAHRRAGARPKTSAGRTDTDKVNHTRCGTRAFAEPAYA